MINKRYAKELCCDDISLIKNYEAAINDKTQTWDCHHIIEVQGHFQNSSRLLKKCGLYYKVPAWQLVFLKHSEHISFHQKNLSETTKQRMKKAAHKKAVCQYSLQGEMLAEFPSIKEAHRKTSINTGNIAKCCAGMYKQSGGFVWRYKE